MARYRAKRDGLKFNITMQDIVLPQRCPVFQTRLRFGARLHKCIPSLDRIDSRKGYVRGNVQIISLRANTLKLDATLDELVTLGSFARTLSYQ